MIGWWRRYWEKREQARQRRLDLLLAMYPHDHPFIVGGLLSATPAIAAASARTLRQAQAQRDFDARLRAIVSDELTKRGLYVKDESDHENAS